MGRVRRKEKGKAYAIEQGKRQPKRWANLRTKTHAKNTVVFKDKKESEDGWWVGLPYKEYLRTSHWRDIRHEFIYKYCNGYVSCHECGRKPTKKELKTGRWKRRFHVHHKTYNNIGHEKMEDLELLCWRCHERIHKNAKANQQPEDNEIPY